MNEKEFVDTSIMVKLPSAAQPFAEGLVVENARPQPGVVQIFKNRSWIDPETKSLRAISMEHPHATNNVVKCILENGEKDAYVLYTDTFDEADKIAQGLSTKNAS